MLYRAEVLAPQAEECGTIEFRVAANAVVGMRVQFLSVPIAPHLLGLILPLDVDRARAPVVFLPRDVVTALQQEDPLPGGGQFPGKCPTSGAGPDDDHVVMILIAHCGLLRGFISSE